MKIFLTLVILMIICHLNTVKCENCKPYYSSSGFYYGEQTCLLYCCGICTSRYCCSTTIFKLDQSTCPPVYKTTTTSNYYSTDELLWFSLLFGTFGTLIVLCAIYSCVKFRANRSRTRRIVLQQRQQQQPSGVYTVGNANANANSAYNYDISTIYNTSFNTSEDLPPSYDSIKVEQKDSSA